MSVALRTTGTNGNRAASRDPFALARELLSWDPLTILPRRPCGVGAGAFAAASNTAMRFCARFNSISSLFARSSGDPSPPGMLCRNKVAPTPPTKRPIARGIKERIKLGSVMRVIRDLTMK